MKSSILKNRSGKVIGRIKENKDNLELRDSRGALLGRYYINSNITRDRSGKLIGRGNLLAMLLR